MPRNLTSSAFMKPFVILALPGMYLFYKYNQYKQQQQEQSRRKVTEKELAHLNHKIDKLLTKLEENEPELATSQEDECVICVNAKATMQTSPCGHRVVCRKCFVKTIQMAVSQRLLPLRCVICRAKILRLKQSSGHGLSYSKSWLMPSSASSYSVSAKSWSAGSSKNYWSDKNCVPSSASQYSMTIRNVPNSASMYSMTSGSSSLSGMSSVSSATNSSVSSTKSSSTHTPAGRGPLLRQPVGSLRKSQQYSMKMKIQEFNEPRLNEEKINEKPPRLAPIVEFQREYRLGKERATSSSTRIRCAQKIVTQLESGPTECEKTRKKSTTSSSSFFKSTLRPSSKEDKKRDKSEDKRKGKVRQDLGKTASEAVKTESKDKKSDKKEVKADKKKNKKESEENKKEKIDKKATKKEGKTEKAELKNLESADKKEPPEKETLFLKNSSSVDDVSKQLAFTRAPAKSLGAEEFSEMKRHQKLESESLVYEMHSFNSANGFHEV